jgi:hypothetical protein
MAPEQSGTPVSLQSLMTDRQLQPEPILPVADELRRLQEVFTSIAPMARAPGTMSGYLPMWDAFCTWCITCLVDPLPCTQQQAAMYLTSVAVGAR